MCIIYIISQLVCSISFVLLKSIVKNRLIPSSKRNPDIEALIKWAELMLRIMHQSLLNANLWMFACEDCIEFIADEEAQDNFYGYREKRSYARLVGTLALESQLYLLSENILRFPQLLNLGAPLSVLVALNAADEVHPALLGADED